MSINTGLRQLYERATTQQLHMATLVCERTIQLYLPLRHQWIDPTNIKACTNVIRNQIQRLRVIRELLAEREEEYD